MAPGDTTTWTVAQVFELVDGGQCCTEAVNKKVRHDGYGTHGVENATVGFGHGRCVMR